MKKKSVKEWSQHIAAVRRSGQSAKEYCRKHRLKENQFYYWRKKLSASEGVKEGKFEAIAVQPSNYTAGTPLSIRLSNGVRLEFSQEPDVEWLRALLQRL